MEEQSGLGRLVGGFVFGFIDFLFQSAFFPRFLSVNVFKEQSAELSSGLNA